MYVGAMVWRIQDLLGLYEQIDWFARHGFQGIAFHTSPSLVEDHATFDVRSAAAADRRRLAAALKPFRGIAIHAEFDTYDVILCSPNELIRRASVQSLERSLELAAELGAESVTVHAGTTRVPCPDSLRRQALRRSMADLADMASAAGVAVGFELTRDYDLAIELGPPIGITLDVGHVSMNDGAGYADFGSLPGLIKHLGDRLVHVHLHDYDGRCDHLPIGHGLIDFAGVLQALGEVRFSGMLCLELSPQCSAGDWLESKRRIEQLLHG